MIAPSQSVEDLMSTEEGRFLEVHHGRLREKPTDMTDSHNLVVSRLNRQLLPQLDPDRYDIRLNSGRVRRAEVTYYVPDLYVVPLASPPSLLRQTHRLEVFIDPLPLVVEVWSPSTGEYDVDEKLPEYMRRGDREIWRIHPVERTLTAWRRQEDGSYATSVHRGGKIEPVALGGVVVDLDALFA